MNQIYEAGVKEGYHQHQVLAIALAVGFLDDTQQKGFKFWLKKIFSRWFYDRTIQLLEELYTVSSLDVTVPDEFSQTCIKWANFNADNSISIHRTKADAITLGGDSELIEKGVRVLITRIPETL